MQLAAEGLLNVEDLVKKQTAMRHTLKKNTALDEAEAVYALFTLFLPFFLLYQGFLSA
jgi:hypothetical protein